MGWGRCHTLVAAWAAMDMGMQLRDLAQRQHAAVAVRQARQLGVTPDGLRHLRRSPAWRALSRRVIALEGAPRTPLQLAMAAVLDAGPLAVASHTLAAGLWELPGFDLRTLEVSRPREQRRPAAGLARLHLPNDLTGTHLTERYGIPLTTLSRTIFDLAPSLHPERLAKLVDRVVSLSPPTLARLHELHTELASRGKDGTVVMRHILEVRPVGYIAPASNLERRVVWIFEQAGERPMRRQVNVGGDEWIGRIDFSDDPPWVLLEVDSRTYHSSLTDAEADARRDAALRAAGFLEIVRVGEDDVWHQPERVLSLVRAARRRVERVHPGAYSTSKSRTSPKLPPTSPKLRRVSGL